MYLDILPNFIYSNIGSLLKTTEEKGAQMNRLSSPLDVQIELTEACNQNCHHCYNYWRQDKRPPTGELAVDQFLIITDQIHSAQVGSVTLTGGEPNVAQICYCLK